MATIRQYQYFVTDDPATGATRAVLRDLREAGCICSHPDCKLPPTKLVITTKDGGVLCTPCCEHHCWPDGDNTHLVMPPAPHQQRAVDLQSQESKG